MSVAGEDPGRLAVASLTFDAGSGELAGPAGVVRIAPQPAALLALIASRTGEVVTRDEIRDHLWPGGRVEFEQGIAFAVREVRKAIEAAGGDPSVLETIPKRGFRLRVAERSTGAPDRAGAGGTGPVAEAPAGSGSGAWRAFVRPLVITVIVGMVGVAALLRGAATESRAAVVVFVHETEDPTHGPLAQAIGFELTTALTRAFSDRLGVVGPTGTAALSGPNDTEGARAALGACLVVSGGIRAVGRDSLVVFTQAIRTVDRSHAWAAQDTVPVDGAAAVVVPHVVEGIRLAAEAC